MGKSLYLVDVSSLFFRAFYAIPPLTTATGLPTNALYGFMSMSIRLLRENKPDKIAFCFDRKEPSFRAELYSEYKANRSEMPEDLVPQMPYMRQIGEKLGVTCIDSAGFEADDVIGTLALIGEKAGYDVTIVSGDKDFAQLVSPRITLLDTMKNVRVDVAGTKEKWGVEPSQMIDYLAIVGDTSDNVPGVKGIGPKGAEKLLAEYGSLEGIYQNIDSIKSASIKEKLLVSQTQAFLAKKLVTIVTDVPNMPEIDQLAIRPLDKQDLTLFLTELEFTQLLKKLFPDSEITSGQTPVSQFEKPVVKKKMVQDVSNPFVKRVEKTGVEANKSSNQIGDNSNGGAQSASNDGEPTGAITQRSLLEMQNESQTEESAGQLPTFQVGVDQNYKTWNLEDVSNRIEPYKEVWLSVSERGVAIGYDKRIYQFDGDPKKLGPVLERKWIKPKGFDLKVIYHALGFGKGLPPEWDAMLASYVVRTTSSEDWSDVFTHFSKSKLPELRSPADDLKALQFVDAEIRRQLDHVNGFHVLEKLELPLVPVLFEMESRGVEIRKETLSKQSVALTDDIRGLEKKVWELAGQEFNVASPKQLGQILFEKLGLPSGKKTKTGFSTDSDVLGKLAREFEICKWVIEFRELSKLKSTYVDALPALVSQQTGRLHSEFHQGVTQTGRLSSTNPNLQNIPIRTERGRAIREAFVAPVGSSLLSIDYSQIELRVLAEITGDPGLTAAFQRDLDIHAATAADIFSVPVDQVNSDQRRMAKAVNFGIAYGQGAFGLAETLEIPQKQAKEIIENYFQKFSKVRDYMLATVDRANEQGYVESMFGRRRLLPELKSPSQMVRKFGERAAINAPIQGTASDLMKLAMIKVHAATRATLILQVHDELLFECPDSILESESQVIQKIMESAWDKKTPLKVNAASGKDWLNAHA
jgi:DNA polymerase-1